MPFNFLTIAEFFK